MEKSIGTRARVRGSRYSRRIASVKRTRLSSSVAKILVGLGSIRQMSRLNAGRVAVDNDNSSHRTR